MNTRKNLARWGAVILAAAACSLALAQSLPTPASSVDSGARAVVSIDIAGVRNTANAAYNTANSAYGTANWAANTANSAYNTANAAYGNTAPWPRHFIGQAQTAYDPNWGPMGTIYIDGNGALVAVDRFGNQAFMGWQGSASVAKAVVGTEGFYAEVSSYDSNGVPNGWRVGAWDTNLSATPTGI